MPTPGSIHGLVPFAHSEDIAASISFYEGLGFEIIETFEPHGRLTWCMLRSGRALLMLAAADSPIDRTRQGVLFYLYTEDLASFHDSLDGEQVVFGEIESGPTGLLQFRIDDPDGYCLMVAEVSAADFDGGTGAG
ncbi:MAG TPA: VOC family protein [Solirubrobacterales bacterium]|nr:VOC family protein [Solirubrobacterales bacterium]